MLALTAASPAHRGHLVNTDCRWNIIAAAVDDRNADTLKIIKTNLNYENDKHHHNTIHIISVVVDPELFPGSGLICSGSSL